MNSNGLVEKHWLRVLVSFCMDSSLFIVAFIVAMLVHTDQDWMMHLEKGWPGLVVGAVALSSFSYILGLYSPNAAAPRQSTMRLLLTVMLHTGLAFSGAILLTVIFFYINFSTRIGRGIMAYGYPLSYLLLTVHHLLLRRSHVNQFSLRICFIINSAKDEACSPLLQALDGSTVQVVGVVTGSEGQLTDSKWPILGTVDRIEELVKEHRLDRVICSSETLSEDELRNRICTLRYSGVTVMPLLSLCEELFQCVPIPLVSAQWLLTASGSPQMQYIRKLKRGFDLLIASVGLLLLSPLLGLAMLAVRLTSAGPVIYRQRRCGRFGVEFELLKVRTMSVDAEKDGEAKWSTTNDPRVTAVGKFLRKYRIDEIPQLINVLHGEMSFVGPRPERPEFIDMLAKEIPYFRERLMIHPGVTGWAQVNFPYGTSVDDARRKLEYDLYYMKYMGLFLDTFILLDTTRIVLSGSVWKTPRQDVTAYLQIAESRQARLKQPEISP